MSNITQNMKHWITFTVVSIIIGAAMGNTADFIIEAFKYG